MSDSRGGDALTRMRAFTSSRGAEISNFAFRLAGALLAFVAFTLVARATERDDLGVISFALAWLLVLQAIGSVGIDTAAVRFLPVLARSGREATAEFIGFSTRICAVVSVSVAVLTVAVSGLAFGVDDPRFTALLVVSVGLWPVVQVAVLDGELRGLEDPIWATAGRWVIVNLAFGAGVAVAWGASAGTVAVTTVMILRVAASGVASLVMRLRRGHAIAAIDRSASGPPSPVDADYARPTWLGTCIRLTLVSGFGLLLIQSDLLVLGFVVEAEEVASYAVGVRVASLIVLSQAAVNGVVGPRLVMALSSGRPAEMMAETRQASRTALLMGAAIALPALVGFPLVERLLGGDFDDAFEVTAVLVVVHLVGAYFGPLNLLLKVSGDERVVLTTGVWALVLNVVLTGALAVGFGVIGAAVGTLTTAVVRNLALMRAATARHGSSGGSIRRRWPGP